MKQVLIFAFVVLIQKPFFAQNVDDSKTRFSLTTFLFPKGISEFDSTRVKYRITTQPTQYYVYDFPITFEKVCKRRTFGITFSYRPSTQNSGEIKAWGTGMFGYYTYQNFYNNLYNAITIGLNSKYYFSKRWNLFVDAKLFYRYWWFDNKYCFYNNNEGYRFNAIRTERQDIFGLKILYGKTLLFKVKAKIKPVVDLFCGVGLRYRTYVFETFNGTLKEEHYPYKDKYYIYKKETGSSWEPTIQFGLRVGVGI